MAEITKKEVIIDVKVERDKRIEELLNKMEQLTKGITEADLELEKFHKQLKSGEIGTAEYAKAVTRLREERKTAVKQLQSLSREEQNLVVANASAKNSLNALRAELNALKVQIADIDIDSPEFAKMAQQMDTITQKVSKAEQSYGVFSRNVGNYASGFTAVGFQVQQIARELPTLSVGLPQFFLALSNNIPMLTDAIAKERAEIKAEQEAVKAGTKAKVEHDSITKQLRKSIFSWQTGLVVVIALITMYGDEIVAWAKKVIKGKDALEDFRKSASAMVGSIAKERAELVGLFNALAQAEEGTANYLAVRNTILDKYGDLLENEREEVKNLNSIAEAYDLISKKITGKAIMEGFNKQIEEQSKTFAETYKNYYDELLPKFTEVFGDEGISKLTEYLDLLTEGTDESKAKAEQLVNAFNFSYLTQGGGTQLVNALTQKISALGNVRDSEYAIEKMANKFAELQAPIKATTEAMTELGKVYNADLLGGGKGKGGNEDNEAFRKAQRDLELAQKSAEEQLKLERATAYNTDQIYTAGETEKFNFAQQWDRKEFELAQAHEKAMLDLQLKYGEITQEEYNTRNGILASQAGTFYQEQQTELAEHLKEVREQILKDADKLRKDTAKANQENEIATAKNAWKEYRDEVARVLKEGGITQVEAEELLALSAENEERQIEDIIRKYAKAEERAVRELERLIKEDVERLYSDDLRQFSDSQTERLRLAIEMKEKEIAELRAKGLETYEQEADLAHLRKDLQTTLYQDELALAWKSADQQYEITKRYLEEQLKLYEGNEAEQARIQKEIADNEANRLRERLNKFNEYSSAVGDVTSAANDLAQNLLARQLETEQANNEMAQNDLEKRYNAGLIKQAEYNRQKAQLDEQLAKKEAEIQRKQAIYERSLAVFQLGIDTASGIMNIWANHAANPVMAGILTAALAATSALQLGAILAEPLPKARKGGLIEGATHEGGGVLVETERDERIIASAPAKAFPELLNLMSYIGKHARIPNTGYAQRHSQNSIQQGELIAQEVGKQINVAMKSESERQAQVISREVGKSVGKELRNLKIYTAITDVRKAEKQYNDIVSSAEM